MSKFVLAALLGCLLLAAPAFGSGGGDDEGPAVDEKDVVVLTDANWDEVIKGSKFALVRLRR